MKGNCIAIKNLHIWTFAHLHISFLLLFLFFSSCVLFVNRPEEKYTLSVSWSNVNLSQSKAWPCNGYGRGRSEYYTDVNEQDAYNEKCRKAFESSLQSSGAFCSKKDGAVGEVHVVVTGFHVSEKITTKKDPADNDCFYLHDISASIFVDVYLNGEKIDELSRTCSNSQDITANSKNTGYKIDNTLISADNIMKRASNHGAYAVISKVSKTEKRKRKGE